MSSQSNDLQRALRLSFQAATTADWFLAKQELLVEGQEPPIASVAAWGDARLRVFESRDLVRSFAYGS